MDYLYQGDESIDTQSESAGPCGHAALSGTVMDQWAA